LEKLNCDIVGSALFADHYHYPRNDLEQIKHSAKSSEASMIVCTHKDLVKIGANQLGGIPVYAVIVDVEFLSGEKELETHLKKLAHPEGAPKPSPI
jgi:tetraacyldisaccharide 4'-kinase